MLEARISIPEGHFRASIDDDAAARERRRIAEMLRRGETLTINQNGTLHRGGGRNGTRVVGGRAELVVPEGKLA